MDRKRSTCVMTCSGSDKHWKWVNRFSLRPLIFLSSIIDLFALHQFLNSYCLQSKYVNPFKETLFLFYLHVPGVMKDDKQASNTRNSDVVCIPLWALLYCFIKWNDYYVCYMRTQEVVDIISVLVFFTSFQIFWYKILFK